MKAIVKLQCDILLKHVRRELEGDRKDEGDFIADSLMEAYLLGKKESEDAKSTKSEPQHRCKCGHTSLMHDQFENQCQGEDWDNDVLYYRHCKCKKFSKDTKLTHGCGKYEREIHCFCGDRKRKNGKPVLCSKCRQDTKSELEAEVFGLGNALEDYKKENKELKRANKIMEEELKKLGAFQLKNVEDTKEEIKRCLRCGKERNLIQSMCMRCTKKVKYLADTKSEPLCRNCGGQIKIRNPTGKCDHLYYPDYLTEEQLKKVNDPEDRQHAPGGKK